MNIIIKKAIFVIIIGMLSPFFLSAQEKISPGKVAKATPKPAESGVTEEEADPDDVRRAISEIVSILRKEKESDPVQGTLLMSYANIFARFSECARIETDTRVTAVWYKNVSESLFQLLEINVNIEAATCNQEEKQLKELKKTYRESLANAIYLLEHPQKLSEKK